ncbi:MAG: VCBS repeat-containing protein, partial [Lentimicrobium sp.]|nr:VCBS repeat-containing protein [Lentimicrobium sp.]MDD4599320.1 FG-GAP-like repeat-containing protein [Lentimicrobiaceae bacterium]
MKKYFWLFIVVAAILHPGTRGFGQQQASTFTLDKQLYGQQEYRASQYIDMINGFGYKATSQSDVFHAKIDPFMVFPPVGGEIGGPTAGDQGVVGSIAGVFDVNDLGAGIYTVPINLPQGIGNNTPQLSLNYNSMAGNGIMGIGWNIGGTSAISRTGKTIYHDSYVEGVKFDANDNFVFNGNRMLPVNNNTYTTEVEEFTRIIVKGTNAYGPIWFEAKTKDGRILRYGETPNSRQKLEGTGATITWYLSSTEDISGNLISYNYELKEGNLLLKTISYGGNSITEQEHFYKINFNYTEYRIDPFTSYINGTAYTTKSLLDRINVIYIPNNKNFLTYILEYDIETSIFSRLANIKVFDEVNKTGFNPTTIEWGETTESFNFDETNITTRPGFENNYTLGDFNGDGKTDILVAYYDNVNKKFESWAIYYHNASGTSYNKMEMGPLDEEYQARFAYFEAGDFNGDGIDDLFKVTHTVNDRFKGNFLISDGNNNFTYVGVLPVDLLPDHYINITDMNGNGINEILLANQLNPNPMLPFIITIFRCFELHEIVGQNYSVINSLFSQPPVTNDGYTFTHFRGTYQIKPGDFNGDGRTDLLVNILPGESTILCLHPTEPILVELTSTRFDFPNENHRVFTGDFNGDGITDILTYDYKGSQQYKWNLFHFDGKNSWQSASCPITSNGDPEDENNQRVIYTTDINGDGKADIMDMHYCFASIYYSTGDGFKTKEVESFTNIKPYKSSIHNFFDFNGDGKSELFVRTTNLEFMHIMSFHKNEKSNLATSFTNGLGKKTTVNYLPLTDAQVYGKDSQVQFPLCNIQPAVYVVKSRKDDIGNAHVVTQFYNYNNLLIHKQGKGLLGFKSRSIFDNQTEINSIITNDIYIYKNKFYFPYQKKIEIYNQRGQVFLETTNKFNHIGYSTSPLRFFPYMENSHSFESEISLNEFVRTTRSIFSYDTYGNLIAKKILVDPVKRTSSTSHSEYMHETNTTITHKEPDSINWITGLPEQINVKVRYLSEVKDEVTTNLTYYEADETNFTLLKEKNVYPGNNLTGNLTTKQSYFYDDYGNMDSTAIDAPFSQPPLEARSSASNYSTVYKHRFPTTTYNAMEQASTATYDPMYGTMKTLTDPNGLTSHYESNPLGNFKETTSPTGIKAITVTRWATGHPHAPTDALYYTWQQSSGTPEVLVFYNKTGAELRTVTLGFDGSVLYMNKIYTPQGLLHKESLPYIQGSIPAYTEYLYDDYNRLETIISPDGTTTTTTYGANETSVTTTNEGISRTTTKKFNAAGWLIESTDNKGNVVKNEYYCNGNLSKTYIVGQPATTVSLEYDDRGNRTLLDDPNYGQMTSIYNAFGELEQQTNPRDEITSYSYNKLGQTTVETSIEGTTTWLYSTTPRRIGTLESITKNNHLTNYIYDDFLRPKSVTKTIAGEPYTTKFTYDELGRLETTTHPTGITVSEGYNDWGFHASVKMNQNALWKTEEVNPLGMITQFKTGNGLITDQTFHPLNMRLQTVKTLKQGNAPIQNYEYSWFGLGNLRHRKKGPLTESFTYDDLDRLDKIKLNGVQTGNHEYDTYNGVQATALGNITKKNNDGRDIFNDAIYGGSNGLITYGPHALSIVSTSNPVLTGPEQVITYNGYDKVDAITEGIHSLHIQYGHHKQRIAQQYTNGSNSIDKVWAGACEYITKNGQLYKHTYLSGPMGVFAVHIINPNGTEEINYIHKDHLGSWNTITDKDGSLLQELSFDAWGNRRDPATWRAFSGTAPEALFDRGFTGHEHLYAFNLINMNGRVYDPIVGRMLSPDNFIQAPDYTQSFNRYSYCWNNPLKYTDPTGYELGVENRNNWFWWVYRGGSYSSHAIGPGSGNHWSDA